MIIDMHCHILPGVDDGAYDEGSMERMLRIADAEGIEGIVATPHYTLGEDEKELEAIKNKYALTQKAWKAYGLQKELYLGSELLWEDGIVEALDSQKALTMNGTSYVLVEFLPDVGAACVENAVRRLQYAGYLPIIAHVERYERLGGRRVLRELVDMGAYLQVNVSTILGKHGFLLRHRAISWMREGLIHFVGSDGHNSRTRRPQMRECAQYLDKKLGVTRTSQILEKNPMRMLEGEKLDG